VRSAVIAISGLVGFLTGISHWLISKAWSAKGRAPGSAPGHFRPTNPQLPLAHYRLGRESGRFT